MTRIVAVAFPKGGTAKSSTAANLAAAAAKKGYSTLLIDLDPQGSSGTVISGVACGEEGRCASAMFQDAPIPPSELAVPSKHGYDVIPAGPGLIKAETWLMTAPLGVQRLARTFNKDDCLKRYDLVFVDTVGAKVRLLDAAVMASTDVLMPVTASVLSLNELAEFLSICEILSEGRHGFGYAPLNLLGVVFVRAKETTRAAKLAFGEMNEAMQEGLIRRLSTVIPDATAMEDAARAGAPVVCLRPSSPVSQSYMALFDELFSGVKKKIKFRELA